MNYHYKQLRSGLFAWTVTAKMVMELIQQLIWPDRRWSSESHLSGKTVVITGGSSGIGLETVRDLASRGARVIIGCRDTTKCNQVVRDAIIAGRDITIKKLDLASFASIRSFAHDVLQEEPKIHLLINNAGLAGCPYLKTEDGFEMQFGVNHLGHFLLTLLLVNRLKESAPARIVNVSSMVHFFGSIHFNDINLEENYNHIKGYAQSKLAVILFNKELAERLKGSGVTTYSLHPGVIHTDLGRNLRESVGGAGKWFFHFVSRVFFKNVKAGARTTLYCAIEESLANESGCYYSGCRKVQPAAKARDDESAKTLWKLSESLTGIKLNLEKHDKMV